MPRPLTAVPATPAPRAALRARLLGLAVALLAALPLRLNRALGAGGGWLAWRVGGRAKRFTHVNLALCFPGMPDEERDALARRSLIEDGVGATETAWCWRRDPQGWLSRRVRVHGVEHYERARAHGRGTLVVTPHMGAWEVGMPVAAQRGTLRYFYRVPRDASLEPLLRAGRANLSGVPLRLDAGGIRDALKALRAGEPVGILPDQEPDRDGGAFAPFFGVPALTMTLLGRLAARSGAQVVFLVAVRCPGGWRAHYLPAEPGVDDVDPRIATAALNRSVERCIALSPEQYLWSYRRLRALPDGGRRDYRIAR